MSSKQHLSKYLQDKSDHIVWIILLLAALVLLVSVPAGYARHHRPNPPAVNEPAKSEVAADSALLAYQQLGLANLKLSTTAFIQAWQGFHNLEQKGLLHKPIIAIADFSQPSSQKRLYIIDLQQMRLLVHTLVAHGRNSGDKMATRFSNQPSSLQSSPGLYTTGDTYHGSNGYSLRLHGQEPGVNDAAYRRAVVMHGASYVSEAIAQATGRIGRSWGCPAVSQAEHKQIINMLKDGACLFIYTPKQPTVAQP